MLVEGVNVLILDKPDKSDPCNLAVVIHARAYIDEKLRTWTARAEFRADKYESPHVVLERCFAALLQDVLNG